MADAGVDVLRDSVLQEVFGSHDRYVGIRVDDPEHAAEVVQVGVGVDHRGDFPVAAVLRYKPIAAAAHSCEISGSMTITPVSPSIRVMFDMSRSRTW